MSADAGQARASRRDALLEAAAAEIAATGVRGLSMDAVARRAGTTAPLLYYHFPSEGDLVRGALRYANDLAPSINLLADRDDVSGFEALRAALVAEFDDDPHVRNLNLIWNEVSALAVFDGDVRSELREVTAHWNDSVTVGLLRGIADGSVRPDIEPRLTAETLTALVEGLSQRWLAQSLSADEARGALERAMAALIAAV
jgi:AcrR family transcriptional regulator